MKRTIARLIVVLMLLWATAFGQLADKAHELGSLHYKLAMCEWLMMNNYECLENLNWAEIDSIFAIEANTYYKSLDDIRSK